MQTCLFVVIVCLFIGVLCNAAFGLLIFFISMICTRQRAGSKRVSWMIRGWIIWGITHLLPVGFYEFWKFWYGRQGKKLGACQVGGWRDPIEVLGAYNELRVITEKGFARAYSSDCSGSMDFICSQSDKISQVVHAYAFWGNDDT